jgi:hypothetical protein
MRVSSRAGGGGRGWTHARERGLERQSVAARGWLSADIRRGGHRRVTGVLPYTQGVAGCSEKLGIGRPARPLKRGGGCGLPLQTCGGVAVRGLDEGDKVGVVAVVVLNENAIVLEANNGYTVAGIFCERCEAEAEGGTGADGVAVWCGRFTPIKRVDGPWQTEAYRSRTG